VFCSYSPLKASPGPSEGGEIGRILIYYFSFVNFPVLSLTNYFLIIFVLSFACGSSHFANLPQLLQVGETEQLAVIFLFATRYPAEAVIPPIIRSLPAVLKNSFRFMVLFYFHCAVHGSPTFQFAVVDAPFKSYSISFPPVETGGYSLSTPSGLKCNSQYVS
jgi:hypothetical protein